MDAFGRSVALATWLRGYDRKWLRADLVAAGDPERDGVEDVIAALRPASA